ncbi:hypothetical protein SNE40_013492 [Patella caerulea]|uniref:Uncharacterized protein n=1 Tax=Patella caerulea TaxID=87958 RepID=A0AAN8JJH4_PATCE
MHVDFHRKLLKHRIERRLETIRERRQLLTVEDEKLKTQRQILRRVRTEMNMRDANLSMIYYEAEKETEDDTEKPNIQTTTRVTKSNSLSALFKIERTASFKRSIQRRLTFNLFQKPKKKDRLTSLEVLPETLYKNGLKCTLC